jgi:hypothetical protein
VSEKKNHVTVIANTNKLFQIETEDGTTISQTRTGGQSINGQTQGSTAQDDEDKQDTEERAQKRKEREALHAKKMKEKDEQADTFGFDLTDMCAFSKGECPINFDDKGLVGVLLADDKYDQLNPFEVQKAGANPDVGYKWTHPRLCCATSKAANAKDLYVLSKSCPDGNTDLLGGVTYLASEFANNPFQKEQSHDYNKFLKWIHPYVCKLKEGNADFNTEHRSCLLAKQCGGDFQDFGFTGLIVRLSDFTKQPFKGSDEQEFGEYKGWRWAHPKLCCNAKGH